MSEQIKKINFSALKNNNTDIINEKKMTSSPELIKQETTSTGIKPKIQISLGKKKNILKKDETGIKEIIEKEENIVKNETSDKVIKTENISQTKETIKKEKIITKNENNIEKNKADEEVIIGDEILQKEPEKLFSNYESDFSVKQDSIIDKIKKLKNNPKARPILVYGMLGFLIIGISGLVFISPDDSYLKASILGVKQKEVKVKNELSKIDRKKALELKIKSEKEKYEKRKKEKLENFLLHKNKKIKNKEEKLKKLLLEGKKTE